MGAPAKALHSGSRGRVMCMEQVYSRLVKMADVCSTDIMVVSSRRGSCWGTALRQQGQGGVHGHRCSAGLL